MVPQQQQEVDQKRRKQTLERAKVNHLSKQLQMRLRYARLKVEYGWQRQSLNEVENLYFHHSHLRTSRVPPPATLTKPHTTSTGDEKEDSLFASMLVDDPATSSQQTNSSSSPDRMLAFQVSELPTIEDVLDAPRSATIGQGQLLDTSSQPSQSQPNPGWPGAECEHERADSDTDAARSPGSLIEPFSSYVCPLRSFDLDPTCAVAITGIRESLNRNPNRRRYHR
ncbi:hypothetical protein F5141DRAFT_362433 [Pisolithus sp. B1]|nr:hypothetical protein F5141DRAFT_362433 [Pisolithus sp. B1]